MDVAAAILLTILFVAISPVSAKGNKFVKITHGLHPDLLTNVIDNVTMSSKNMCGAYCTQKNCLSMLYHETSGTCTLFALYKSDTSAAVDTLYALEKAVCGQLTASTAFIGSLVVTGIYTDDTASYTCNTGYEVTTGDALRTCGLDGQWGGQEPTCELIVCGQLTASTAFIGSLVVTGIYLGNTASYTCNTGYEVTTGDALRTCRLDGQWSGQEPTCGLIVCGQLTASTAFIGSLVVTGVYLGNTASYTCNTGYEVTTGDALRTCRLDGQWSGQEPTCELIVCDILTPSFVFIGSGSLLVTGFYTGDTASYTCNTGYEVTTGDALRTCGLDGQWSGHEPTCELIDCGVPAAVANSYSLILATTYNSHATYLCSSGYELTSGKSSRLCGSDGQWSGQAPTCSPADTD